MRWTEGRRHGSAAAHLGVNNEVHGRRARKPVAPMVQVSCGQTERFLKCVRSRKDFASWLFDLNDKNYFILEARTGRYLFDAGFNGRGIGKHALFWFGIGLGRLETPQGCGSVRTL